jgi:hypothetical protein
MAYKIRFSVQLIVPITVGACLLALFAYVQPTAAITLIPTPTPEAGSYGLEATKTQPPPTQGATITSPSNGAGFSTSPITVTGICPAGLLVQVYDNGVMVGSSMCANLSFSVQVSLFTGSNALNAIVYDDLGQAGPTSNTNTVTYNNTKFSAFGALITLTSTYGRLSAPTGAELSWPLQLSGGTGPYAFSIDWGDGSSVDLKSQSLAGLVTIEHVYKNAGIYQTNIRATDVNGVSAFLQVVAVANGVATTSTSSSNGQTATTTSVTKVVWIPAVVAVLLLFPAYWLGRRSEVVSIRNKLLKDRDSYEEKEQQ